MSLLEDSLRDQTRLFLDDTDGLNEEVVYRPSDGLPRTIRAYVERKGPLERDGVRPASSSGIVMLGVLNDAVSGISSAEIDLTVDLVELPERFGREAGNKGRKAFRMRYPEDGLEWHNSTMIWLELYT